MTQLSRVLAAVADERQEIAFSRAELDLREARLDVIESYAVAEGREQASESPATDVRVVPADNPTTPEPADPGLPPGPAQAPTPAGEPSRDDDGHAIALGPDLRPLVDYSPFAPRDLSPSAEPEPAPDESPTGEPDASEAPRGEPTEPEPEVWPDEDADLLARAAAQDREEMGPGIRGPVAHPTRPPTAADVVADDLVTAGQRTEHIDAEILRLLGIGGLDQAALLGEVPWHRSTVQGALRRLRAEGKVKSVDGIWQLVAEGETPQAPRDIHQERADAVVAFISANPGCQARDLYRGLVDLTPDTARAIVEKLRREGCVRMEGNRGGARYFPATEAAVA